MFPVTVFATIARFARDAYPTTPVEVQSASRPSHPRVYDIRTDTMRPMTEAEVDAWRNPQVRDWIIFERASKLIAYSLTHDTTRDATETEAAIWRARNVAQETPNAEGL